MIPYGELCKKYKHEESVKKIEKVLEELKQFTEPLKLIRLETEHAWERLYYFETDIIDLIMTVDMDNLYDYNPGTKVVYFDMKDGKFYSKIQIPQEKLNEWSVLFNEILDHLLTERY